MAGTIEEIGARLVLKGRAEFLRATAEVKKEMTSVGKTAEVTDAKIIASNRAVMDAQAQLATKSAEYAALREKQARLVSLAAEQEAGAVRDALLVEADAMKLATRAAREQQTAAGASLRAARESAKGIALANTEMAASTEASASRFGRAMSGLTKFGKVATIGLVAGAALVGVASVHAAGNFQQSMTLVQTMAGVSHDRIASLSKGLLNMAPGVAAGPTALADALYRISSANSGLGATNTQLLAMTKAAAQLNLIGGGNDSTLGETARVLGGVRASNIKGAGGYQNIVSLAAATVGSGDMKMGDFISALGTGVLPAAANFGVKLPDVGALLSVLTDNLIPGSTAGSVMSHMFSLMGAPAGPGRKAFEAIGLHPTDLNYTMRNQGLIPALGELRTRLAAPQTGAVAGGRAAEQGLLRSFGFTKAQTTQIMTKGADKAEQAIFMTRAFGGAKQSVPIITALEEYPRLVKRQAQIAKQSNPSNAQAAIAAATDTFNNKVKKLESSLQVLEINIGNKLIPVLISVAHGVMTVVHWFEKHKTTAEALGAAVGVVLVAAIGLFTYALIAATVAFLGLTWPITATIAVMALLAAGFVVLWHSSETFRTIVVKVFQEVGTMVLQVVRVMLEEIRALAWVSDKLFGTHFTKTIDGAISGIDKLQYKLNHMNDPKPIKLTVLITQADVLGDRHGHGASPSRPATYYSGGGHPVGQAPPSVDSLLGIPGTRARGGPIRAGMPYIVGEQGPELITPSRSGHVSTAAETSAMLGRGVHIDQFIVQGIVQNPEQMYEAAKRGIADAMARA